MSGINLGIGQNKVAVLLKEPIPQCRRDMQSLLGFARYYRQQMKAIAEISKPLTEVCKLEVVYEFTNEILNAFHQLRTKLTTAPLLLFPDWKLLFKLYVDARMNGLAVDPHQQQGVHDILTEVPIAFISRQLKDSEGRCGARQLEGLNLVWALKKLH